MGVLIPPDGDGEGSPCGEMSPVAPYNTPFLTHSPDGVTFGAAVDIIWPLLFFAAAHNLPILRTGK